MVRKIRGVLVAIFVCVLTCFSMCTHTYAYTVYEGSFSSTYVTYFRDILAKCSYSDDYVAFRSGQYDYIMVVGDIEYKNGRFTSTDTLDLYKFSTNSSYNSNYYLTVSTENNFSLDSNDYIVYSNLGYFPSLSERGEILNYATFFAIICLCVCSLIRPIFKFNLRSR